MKNVALHIMSESAREKYDLEALYSNDSVVDGIDDDMIPPPSQTSSSTPVSSAQ